MSSQTVIIRNRFQITIPASLRKAVDWLLPEKAVKLSLLGKEKVLLEPYKLDQVNWSKILTSLEEIRKTGKKTSLADFVINDRLAH
jgi:bifunctional DNA-binding transcriptional regulator/antitoxin component of YhaV-PrlF toxin-antitoxin module